MAKNQAAAEAARNDIASGLAYKPLEKKKAAPAKPAEPEIVEKTEIVQEKPAVAKPAKAGRDSAKDSYKKMYAANKKDTRKNSRIVYLSDSLNEKVSKASKSGEIKSFNDLVNFLLEDYFKE